MNRNFTSEFSVTAQRWMDGGRRDYQEYDDDDDDDDDDERTLAESSTADE